MARHDIDELYSMALTEGLRAPVAVFSGTADLTGNGVKVVDDLAGDQLSAVLAGGVAVLKVSHEELIDAGRAEDDSVDALTAAAYRLREEGAAAVMIGHADQPGPALLDDEVLKVRVPQLQVVDHHGAGDSMTAGIAAVLVKAVTCTRQSGPAPRPER
ncbi:PfkB family carbohydrate kinase [Catenuloplanes indicus]|uniref:Fructose-1-phosphate kinase PfkB-like protein n=1 Tax=Catenuloplanes indicus TaxID=137267 RepID=A0AAE4AYJ7_9ACTN|nr:PfkB family carbohydrate kinase [Catenuloplanes indicus]MDQ0365118.1 fructose-1-phosphate kinase PfkB-like protein [Catenuloplanes indicus]